MAANEAELRALMRASLAGDASAHRTLLSRLSANLRAYYKTRLARIGRSATEAEDLTQEALMAIHTRRHTYDPSEALTPWVYAIARYKLIDHLRHTRASMTDLPIEDAEELTAQDDYVGTESANDEAAERAAGQNAAGNPGRETGRFERGRGGKPVRHVGIGREGQRASGTEGFGRLDCPGEAHMKTEDLISMLSTNVEVVDHRRVGRNIGMAVVAGAAVAVAMVFIVLGPRADLTTVGTFIPSLLKVAFTVIILVPASIYLIRLTRPGGERSSSVALVALPFIAIMLLVVLSLGFAPGSHWKGAVLSDEWLECVISIPLIAIVPFAVIIWAVRQMAPTDLARTGAFAGLVAGCLSATGYALHCADDSVPFFALWYGGTIALCTFAGWQLGPKLLRW
jgi:RNA polymerase sigma factor (sigma-70 family)